MTGALSTAALLVTVAALVSAAAALLATRRIVPTLSVLLDMLLAASLLRLALDPTPVQLAGTALLVLVKRLASAGLRRATAVRARTSMPAPSPPRRWAP
ncbi:hypothetical protein [Modestobacter excelsi]|uniref:hypothetical protein n=1 Tax=Modestobacter excelsi TaxID=2213161 RepID=UPI00110CAD8D|nr:hypothetical protein [Modestobacter excelsi]